MLANSKPSAADLAAVARLLGKPDQERLTILREWKVERSSFVGMLRVRRAFGIGCTCPTGANQSGRPNHHFACGVNARAWG